MDILEKIYILTAGAAIATLGVGCDDWKRCKCEDCVLLRKTIVKTLQKIGYNRRQIATYTGVSRSAIASYLSDYSNSPILSKIDTEICRILSEKGVSIRKL